MKKESAAEAVVMFFFLILIYVVYWSNATSFPASEVQAELEMAYSDVTLGPSKIFWVPAFGPWAWGCSRDDMVGFQFQAKGRGGEDITGKACVRFLTRRIQIVPQPGNP